MRGLIEVHNRGAEFYINREEYNAAFKFYDERPQFNTIDMIRISGDLLKITVVSKGYMKDRNYIKRGGEWAEVLRGGNNNV